MVIVITVVVSLLSLLGVVCRPWPWLVVAHPCASLRFVLPFCVLLPAVAECSGRRDGGVIVVRIFCRLARCSLVRKFAIIAAESRQSWVATHCWSQQYPKPIYKPFTTHTTAAIVVTVARIASTSPAVLLIVTFLHQ